MSRRVSQRVKVELFPFLAVLVCVMGALIFLLLVMTKQLRATAVARARAEAVARQTHQPEPLPEASLVLAPDPLPSSPPEAASPISVDSDPQPVAPGSWTATSRADTAAIELAARIAEQATLQKTWENRVASLELDVEERQTQLNRQQLLARTVEQQMSALKQDVLRRELELAEIMGRQSAVEDQAPESAAARARLEQQIQSLRQQLKQLQDQQRDASTRFAVVPFDGQSGTTRRPILIECTSTGLRFLPEDVTLTPADIEGFIPRFNPLAAGASALIDYWNQPQHQSNGEPYVMLIVRPDGTLAYYIATKLLSGMQRSFGYELVESDFPLQLPPLDLEAKRVVEEAVRRALVEREQILRATGMGSGGAGGNGTGNGTGRYGGGGTLNAATGTQPTGTGRGANGSLPGTSPRAGASAGSSTRPGASQRSDEFSLTQLDSPAEVGERSWQDLDRFGGQEHRRKTGANSSSGSPTGTPASTQPATRASAENSGATESSATNRTGSSGGTPSQGASQGGTPPALLDENEQDSYPRFMQRGKTRAENPLQYEQLQRRKWGPHEPGASIGVERAVVVRVDANHVIVDETLQVPIRSDMSRDEVFQRVLSGVDQAAQTWGQPGNGFFWVPSLRFVISPGGNTTYERVSPLVTRSGLSNSVEHTLQPAIASPREVAP